MDKPDKPNSPSALEPSAARDTLDRAVSALARRALGRKQGALPAASGLDDELLLRYVDGALSTGEREALEQRLSRDLDAKERLSILVGGLADAGFPRHQVAPGALERTLNAVSRHVFYLGSGVLELLRGGDGAKVLVPAAVRGAAHSTQPAAFQIDRLFHTAQGPVTARFELHAERADVAGDEAQGSALADLVVHVDPQGHSVEGVRCKLLRDGKPIDSREVEAAGCTFTRLGPARYDVELRKGGVEIGRVLFDLRG